MSQNKSSRRGKHNRIGNEKLKGSLLRNVGFGFLGTAVVAIILVAIFQAGKATGKLVPLEFAGGPRLKVYQDNLDLGDEKLGQTVPVSFVIANVGNQTLEFTKVPFLEVVKGCCPPNVAIGSMQLRPGESTTVTFSLMMHTGMGGYHDMRLHLDTNDLKQADQTITILSNWVP